MHPTVPVLEFDDGRRIAEVIAICLYFELAHPEPALMGVGAQDRAIVADWHQSTVFAGWLGVFRQRLDRCCFGASAPDR
jgi:glutathione S-transferase